MGVREEKSLQRYILMKFDKLIFSVTILLIYIMATRISIDSDTWWHLRAGQWMVQNRQILTLDIFSYTRYGAEWRYPGWLVEIPMAALVTMFGLGSLNLVSGFLIALTFVFIYWTIEGNHFQKAFLLILAATVSGVYWSARPHLVTLLLTAIFLYIFEKAAQKGYWSFRRKLWISLPVLMLIWVNSHGGFVVGFLLWGIYFFDCLTQAVYDAWLQKQSLKEVLKNQDLQTLTITGIAVGIIANLNPLGYRIFLYPFQTVSIRTLQKFIEEWQSPNFHSLNFQPFIWLLVLLIWVSAFSGKRWLFRDALLVTIFLYLALLAGRNVALFALSAPLPIGRLLAGWKSDNLLKIPFLKRDVSQGNAIKDHPKLNLLIALVLFLGCVYRSYLAYHEPIVQRELDKFYPVEAVKYLKMRMPAGHLFNSYNWGAYLLWELPEYPVFVDGRTDLYNDEVLEQWLKVVQLRDGWEDVIERWQIGVILMEREWNVAKFLQQNGWCKSYQDEIALVLEKCQP